MKNKSLLQVTALTAIGLCMMGVTAYAQQLPDMTGADETTPVDFPQRSSLGEMKEAILPNLTDSAIKDPSPMAVVVSKKAPPSEQLLGRITSEVFHEMADLERGNVFLKLQTQREQLKNDLENLKAQHRQARLTEIEKREGVIRTRVEWMQEQERIRQEILEKKMQTELLEKQVEEAELRKSDLLKDIEKATDQKKTASTDVKEDANKTPVQKTTKIEVVEEVVDETFPTLTLMDVRGMKGKLTARMYGDDGKVFSVKTGQVIPSGYTVKSISKTAVVFTKEGQEKRVEMAPMIVPVAASSAPVAPAADSNQ